MNYKLVDERIQSMMKTINAMKKGMGIEYVSLDLYFSYYGMMQDKLKNQQEGVEHGYQDKKEEKDSTWFYSELNRLIKEAENNVINFLQDDNYNEKIYKECVALSIILHEAKIKLLKRDYSFVGESYK